MSETPQDPLALARACAERMWAEDEASRALGMEIVEIGLGRAVLTMRVRSEMTNGHKTAHGGYVFTLADSAFAFACNGTDQRTVAQSCAITYIAPAREGDLLRAEAVEVHRAGRSGVYDVRVTNQDDALVALFRGHARTVKGRILE
ncbi:hydroxyphenylacetyl-CoA thioesterase PaaI [Salinarimonas sp.]|uniref:hydroxyphenylacetyl-CoA thioesterase PaaI n=1 Tax=Salinarimonas sp. TaxID=2766526 RepID=UPI00391C97E9